MSFILKLFKNRTKQVNLTICGLDNAGKTTIVNYLINGEFKETLPTMGIHKEEINFPKLKLSIYDLGGQVDFRGMWSSVNEKSDALVYVIDSSDHFRLNESKEIFYNVLKTQINSTIPVLILLNKIDLPNRISRIDFINEFNLQNIQLNSNWACFETSAKTGEGILSSFHWFVNVLKDV